MAETTEQQAATIQELRDALDKLCAACKSQKVARIIQACLEGEAVLAKTKESSNAVIP